MEGDPTSLRETLDALGTFTSANLNWSTAVKDRMTNNTMEFRFTADSVSFGKSPDGNYSLVLTTLREFRFKVTLPSSTVGVEVSIVADSGVVNFLFSQNNTWKDLPVLDINGTFTGKVNFNVYAVADFPLPLPVYSYQGREMKIAIHIYKPLEHPPGKWELTLPGNYEQIKQLFLGTFPEFQGANLHFSFPFLGQPGGPYATVNLDVAYVKTWAGPGEAFHLRASDLQAGVKSEGPPPIDVEVAANDVVLDVAFRTPDPVTGKFGNLTAKLTKDVKFRIPELPGLPGYFYEGSELTVNITFVEPRYSVTVEPSELAISQREEPTANVTVTNTTAVSSFVGLGWKCEMPGIEAHFDNGGGMPPFNTTLHVSLKEMVPQGTYKANVSVHDYTGKEYTAPMSITVVPKNVISVDCNLGRWHIKDGDNFLSEEVTGDLVWNLGFGNPEDQTGDIVQDLTLKVENESGLTFNRVDNGGLTNSSTTYEWTLGNVTEGQGGGRSMWNYSAASFTPPLNVTRSVSATNVTLPGTQTLTLKVTPTAAIEWLDININAWSDQSVDAHIKDVRTEPGLRVKPEGGSLWAWIWNPTVNATYTFDVTIELWPRLDISWVEYMPQVRVESGRTVWRYLADGDSITRTVDGLGNVTWNATPRTDVYKWDWGQLESMGVELKGHITAPPPKNDVWVSSNINRWYNTNEDSFTSGGLVTGSKSWNLGYHNSQDGTQAAVQGLTLTVENGTGLAFDMLDERGLTKLSPGTYVWSIGNPGECWSDGRGMGVNESPESFTPLFNVARSVNATNFTKPEVQELTLTVTPTPDSTDPLNIDINVQSDGNVNAWIKEVPTKPEGAQVNWDSQHLWANIQNPTGPYTFVVMISVNPRSDVALVHYMPHISVSSSRTLSHGRTDGDSVSWAPLEGLDNVTWSAKPGTGPYRWSWATSENLGVSLNGYIKPAFKNHISVWCNIDRWSSTHGNFTGGSVTGSKSWNLGFRNENDETQAPVQGLTLAVENTTTLDWWSEDAVRNETHFVWEFGSPGEGHQEGREMRINEPTDEFAPPFTVERSVNPPTMTEPGVQELNLTVTTKDKMDRLSINIHVYGDENVDAWITGVPGNPPEAEVYVAPDKHQLWANIQSPLMGSTYTFIIAINVSPKSGDIASFEYMPDVFVTSTNPIGPATSMGGDSIMCPVDGLGTVTWGANPGSGPYTWDWSISETLGVHLYGYRTAVFKNHISVDSNIHRMYNTNDDSFTSDEVTGDIGWTLGFCNQPDGSQDLVQDLTLTVETEQGLVLDWWSKGEDLTHWDGTYVWSLGDVGEGQWGQRDLGKIGASGPFTPLFDITRSVNPIHMTTSGTQTLTITVTPRAAMEELHIEANIPREDQNVYAYITNVQPPPEANLNWGNEYLWASIRNPSVDTPYTFTVTVYVQLKPGVPWVEYMPLVKARSWNLTSSGFEDDSSITWTVAGLGNVRWSATSQPAPYRLDWSIYEGLNVQLNRYSRTNNVGAWFHVRYTNSTDSDATSNVWLTGDRHLHSGMNNDPDGTSLPVLSPHLMFTTGLEINRVELGNLTTPGEPYPDFPWITTPSNSTLIWTFDDVQEGQGGIVRSVRVGLGEYGFYPGFHAAREFNNTYFTESQEGQRLTIRIVLEEPVDWIDITVDTSMGGGLVDATIISAEGFQIEGGKTARLHLDHPNVGQEYAYTFIIGVTKSTYENVEYKPSVYISTTRFLTWGRVAGSSVSRDLVGIGIWTWTADGQYSWNWNEQVSKDVNFNPTAREAPPPVVGEGYAIEVFAKGLDGPFGLAFKDGDLYVANEGKRAGGGTTISKITPDGLVSTYATGFQGPSGLAFDQYGNLWVSDDGQGINIWKVVEADGIITITGYNFGFANPNAIAFNSTGDWSLYVADTGSGYIYKIPYPYTQGTQTQFTGLFNGPQAVAFGNDGYLYTSDFTGTIYKIDPESGAVVWTWEHALWSTQGGLTFDSSGTPYASEYWSDGLQSVYVLTPGGTWTPFVTGFDPGGFNFPRGLAFYADSLYVTEYGRGIIWKVTPSP